jgi:hypothetical protein
MNRDEAPLALRRPFVRLARGAVTPHMLEMLRGGASADVIAGLLPKFYRRDLQGPWRTFWIEYTNAAAQIMHDAGRRARTWKSVERAPEITVALNPRSKKWIDEHAAALAVELSRQQHEVVRAVIADGYARGSRPEEMAQHLKAVVGLTSRQQSAVSHFADQEDVTDAQVERYANKQLAYRVENISRTENRAAVENGRWNEWREAVDTGELPATTRRQWDSSPDSYRLCENCAELDGQIVGMDEPFHSDELGDIDTAPAHPQCRCTVLAVFD